MSPAGAKQVLAVSAIIILLIFNYGLWQGNTWYNIISSSPINISPQFRTNHTNLIGIQASLTKSAFTQSSTLLPETKTQCKNVSKKCCHPKVIARRKQQDKLGCVRLGYSAVPLPLTLLSSFPGSGNTWVRHLLQQITGIYTGAVFNDWVLKSKGFAGEGRRDSTVIAIKIHGTDFPDKPYQRVIMILRNPYDAMIADYHRLTSGHRGVRMGNTSGTAWAEYVFKKSHNWHGLAISWLRREDVCLYVIQYRKLKTHLREELVNLAAFLSDTPLSPEHLNCVLAHSKGNFKRPKHVIPKDLFTLEMNKTLDSAIRNVTTALESKGIHAVF